MNKVVASVCIMVICGGGGLSAAVEFPGKAPGVAGVESRGTEATLSNSMFSATLRQKGKSVQFGGMKLADGTAVAASGTHLFTIQLADGTSYSSGGLSCSGLEAVELKGDKKAARLAERLPGQALRCRFDTPDGALKITWQAELRDGSHYLRQVMEVEALKDTEFVRLRPLEYEVELGGNLELSGGTTHGKVVVNEQIFCGLETPMSLMEVGGDERTVVTGDWERQTTLKAGQRWRVSSVLGFFAPQQQRRSFLAYLERERAMPYRLFIHYNDWYEIGITCNNNDNPLERNTEKRQLELLADWKREMVQKRRTPIDAFVIDDGWDDFNTLWGFHKGFPNGFSNIDKMIRSMKGGLGTWLGPVGGYGHAKACRLGFWNKHHPGNQIDNFQLSNQEYFDAFVGCCTRMLREYDSMRYFKFDGISAEPHARGPVNLEDAEGILSVIQELRRVKPKLFINTTVGTWSSPFWLLYSDSLWRQEGDFGTMGNLGDKRDQWLNYRDRLVHEVFVQRSPLYPINSIMTHGIIITKNGPPHVMPRNPENCLKEIRSHVGSGTCLQELYVDRALLDQDNGRLWDELASAIRWLRRNEDVLADIHWVGGNPWNRQTNEGDLYGWAAWNPEKCTLTFRNSADRDKTMTTTLRELLDIPPSVKKSSIRLRSSFKGQRVLDIVNKDIDVDATIRITLKPQEVIVMEGRCDAPKKGKKTKRKKSKKKKRS